MKKVLLTGKVAEQERAVREATCLAKLDHPNVVRYYQVWKEEVDAETALADFDDSSEEEFGSGSYTEYTGDSVSASDRSSARDSRRSARRSAREELDVDDPTSPRSVLHIQMQLCEITFREWLKEAGRPTSLEANRPYFVQLLAGLQHIHRNSLIHRDLTPANIFIAADKTVTRPPLPPPRPHPSARFHPHTRPHTRPHIRPHTRPHTRLPHALRTPQVKIGDFGLSREMQSTADGSLTSNSSSVALGDEAAGVAPTPPGVTRESSVRRSHRGSVTRGVGTTLYMSPEQRASRPYDHKVDIFSAGGVLLEMCHAVSTMMERVIVLSDLQRHTLPRETVGTPVGELVLWMTSEEPTARPSVDELLASPLIAAHGDVCVAAERSAMHSLMPAIHSEIERVQRVRSFTAQDGASSDAVFLEYYLEPADELAAASLERMRGLISAMPGVLRVSGSSFVGLWASPLPSPLPSPSAKAAKAKTSPPAALLLPPSHLHPPPPLPPSAHASAQVLSVPASPPASSLSPPLSPPLSSKSSGGTPRSATSHGASPRGSQPTLSMLWRDKPSLQDDSGSCGSSDLGDSSAFTPTSSPLSAHASSPHASSSYSSSHSPASPRSPAQTAEGLALAAAHARHRARSREDVDEGSPLPHSSEAGVAAAEDDRTRDMVPESSADLKPVRRIRSSGDVSP